MHIGFCKKLPTHKANPLCLTDFISDPVFSVHICLALTASYTHYGHIHSE